MYTFLGLIAKPLGLLLSFLYSFIGQYALLCNHIHGRSSSFACILCT